MAEKATYTILPSYMSPFQKVRYVTFMTFESIRLQRERPKYRSSRGCSLIEFTASTSPLWRTVLPANTTYATLPVRGYLN